MYVWSEQRQAASRPLNRLCSLWEAFALKALHVYQPLGPFRLVWVPPLFFTHYFKTASTWPNHHHRAASRHDSRVCCALFRVWVLSCVWGLTNFSSVSCGNWRVCWSGVWSLRLDDNGGSSINWLKLKGLCCNRVGAYLPEVFHKGWEKSATWPTLWRETIAAHHFWQLLRPVCLILALHLHVTF